MEKTEGKGMKNENSKAAFEVMVMHGNREGDRL
jgi:hypothetical protein